MDRVVGCWPDLPVATWKGCSSKRTNWTSEHRAGSHCRYCHNAGLNNIDFAAAGAAFAAAVALDRERRKMSHKSRFAPASGSWWGTYFAVRMSRTGRQSWNWPGLDMVVVVVAAACGSLAVAAAVGTAFADLAGCADEADLVEPARLDWRRSHWHLAGCSSLHGLPG